MDLKKWQDLSIGGIISDGGNSDKVKTGEWRVIRPVWDEDKCIHCMMCWTYCPDTAIKVKDGKMTGIDYYFCKGCGLCAEVCPKNAIEMKPESDFKE